MLKTKLKVSVLALLIILAGCDYAAFKPSPASSTPDPSIISSPSLPSNSPTPSQNLEYETRPTVIQTPAPVPSTSPETSLASPTPSPSRTMAPTADIKPLNLAVDVPDPNQLIPMSYEWEYSGKIWTWKLEIPEAAYQYYKALPRAPTENYSIYVTHPLDDEYITRLANKIEEISKQEGYSEFQKVSFAAAFVQNLPYTSDSTTKGFDEYPRFPIETLVDNGGDCEDTAILMASLVEAMGYGVVLIIFPETTDNQGHAALGIKGGEGIYGTYWEYGGDKYFYLETTDTGWSIGKLPPEYQNVKAQVYPIRVLK